VLPSTFSMVPRRRTVCGCWAKADVQAGIQANVATATNAAPAKTRDEIVMIFLRRAVTIAFSGESLPRT
jgi:hypothetical protein